MAAAQSHGGPDGPDCGTTSVRNGERMRARYLVLGLVVVLAGVVGVLIYRGTATPVNDASSDVVVTMTSTVSGSTTSSAPTSARPSTLVERARLGRPVVHNQEDHPEADHHRPDHVGGRPAGRQCPHGQAQEG